MITLNEIAYNIQNMMYPKSLIDPVREGQISLRQIKHWIHYHRAKLIEENVSKGILNFNNIYQRVNNSTGVKAVQSKGLSFYNSRDFYGRETLRTENRGDWRNLGGILYDIPEIIMLPNNSAIKEVSVRRIISDDNNAVSADESNRMIQLSQRSKTEKEFSSFNKFTNNNKPFYILDRKIDLDSASNNGGLQMQLWGLRISPNNLGDLETPVAENLKFLYYLDYYAILQDPTQINSTEIDINSSQEFDDDTTPYPIPVQYLSDLIERVLQKEGSVSLKTMKDEL